jgi:hypothetical protein
MSTWTHVVGGFRIDGMPQIIPSHTVQSIKDILGPMCLFDDWDDTSTLPRGSEGSLQYKIIEYQHGLPWIMVAIWGDLRDYDNLKEIEDWWNATLAKFDMIRDGCLRIIVEGREPVILTNKETT